MAAGYGQSMEVPLLQVPQGEWGRQILLSRPPLHTPPVWHPPQFSSRVAVGEVLCVTSPAMVFTHQLWSPNQQKSGPKVPALATRLIRGPTQAQALKVSGEETSLEDRPTQPHPHSNNNNSNSMVHSTNTRRGQHRRHVLMIGVPLVTRRMATAPSRR